MMRSSPAGWPVEGNRAETAPGADQDDVGIGGVLHRVFDDVGNDALEHSGVRVDFRHVGGQFHPDTPLRHGAQGVRNDLVPAHGPEQGVGGVGADSGHVQEVAHQAVQPVRAFLDGRQQLLLFVRGVPGAVVAQAADGEFDSGQRSAEVMGDGAEDGRSDRVAFGEAQHLPAAGHELLAFQLGVQMDAEGPQQTPVARRQDPAEQHEARRGVDLFNVLAVGAAPFGFACGKVPGCGKQPPLPPVGARGPSVARGINEAEDGGPPDLEDAQCLLQEGPDHIVGAGCTPGQVAEGRGFRAGAGGFLGPAG